MSKLWLKHIHRANIELQRSRVYLKMLSERKTNIKLKHHLFKHQSTFKMNESKNSKAGSRKLADISNHFPLKLLRLQRT